MHPNVRILLEYQHTSPFFIFTSCQNIFVLPFPNTNSFARAAHAVTNISKQPIEALRHAQQPTPSNARAPAFFPQVSSRFFCFSNVLVSLVQFFVFLRDL